MARHRSIHRLLRLFLTMLPLTALLLLGALPAANSAATEVFTRHFHGLQLFGQTFAQDGCTNSGQTLLADRTQVVYVFSSTNSCTGERSQIIGSAVPTVFKVTSHLGLGHLVATIPLTDVSTGASVGELTIDETFTAARPADIIEDGHSRFLLPGIAVLLEHSSGTTRQGVLTGTITFDFAVISNVSNTSLAVFHF
jgi:hypothetical protein